jgi:hypothetical protein
MTKRKRPRDMTKIAGDLEMKVTKAIVIFGACVILAIIVAECMR